MTNQKKKFYENNTSVTGTLKSMNVKNLTTQAGVPMKIASLSVETGEGETHRVQTMAVAHFEKNGQKEENKQYKAIETMEDKYVTKEDIANGKKDDDGNEYTVATVVNVKGSLELNMYKNKADKLVENTQINARFINSIDTPNPDSFGSEFTLQTFLVSKGVRVMDSDENETDEVKFKAATIDYRGTAHPFEFTANDEYGVATWMEEDAEVGQTLVLQGLNINKYIIEQVERPNPAGIGKPIIDTRREIDRKLLVEGICPIEDEEDTKFITDKEVKEAIKKYEDLKVEKESATNSKASSTVNKGVATSKKTSPVTKAANISDDDLPF
ncbi:hypothetical protein [Staphylococcus gallinarum]|uniref:hypothetical protein n=1 Tax=Staphylococcus gallinarum TaxID=1293 RepID=UPI0030BB9D14